MKGDTALLVHLAFFDTGLLGKPVVTTAPFGSPDLTALVCVIGTAVPFVVNRTSAVVTKYHNKHDIPCNSSSHCYYELPGSTQARHTYQQARPQTNSPSNPQIPWILCWMCSKHSKQDRTWIPRPIRRHSHVMYQTINNNVAYSPPLIQGPKPNLPTDASSAAAILTHQETHCL